jgi:phosphotransferase system enzyme I (PtsI)
VMAGALLEKSDFANIGSNDLLQYTLAASRGNAFVEKRYHVMHPAMVRLMEMVVKAGKRAKKEICLCGEIASFEEFYPVLLGIGLESFSVSVAKFPDIKCHLMHETRPKKSLLRDFYTKSTKEETDRFLGAL